MDLIKDSWTVKDILEFNEYSKTLKGSDKECQWEKRIINTSYECFGKTASKAKLTIAQIKKGNYIEFLHRLGKSFF